MSSFPPEFPVPLDQGGPGKGQPVGGFGGNPAVGRDAHRDVLKRVGKAPVLLVHGNGGAADVGRWDMLDLRRMLRSAGYPDELIWAPSYLASGTVDLLTPHTDNVTDLREFIENVCAFLDVDVVDVIAHSLGCSLTYAVCRGLQQRTAPIDWNQPGRWPRLGTLVALAGAFHGLGTGGLGEWRTGGEFMDELLGETLGGGGETPYGDGRPPTPPPVPHNITYFCGVARGDFIDVQNPGTGHLAGAVNKDYDLGSGLDGHEKIKESPLVFQDFLPLLNRVPPVPPVKLTVDRDSGGYAPPLTVTATVEPAELTVDVLADRLTKAFVNGFIVDTILETRQETVRGGEPLALGSTGMWQVSVSAPGAVDDLVRTYWVGVAPITTTIDQPTRPFSGSLLVTARASDPTARLFHSVDGVVWAEGATVTITQDTTVSFTAINPDGIASAVESRSFTRTPRWDATVTADVVQHFLNDRISAAEFVTYSRQFGFFTPFALYRVAGSWVLDPDRPTELIRRTPAGGPADQALVRVRPGDPQPGEHRGPITVTIEIAGAGGPATGYVTRDGSRPDGGSTAFTGEHRFELVDRGNHVIACYVVDNEGTGHYQAFPYTLAR
jgi:hypothetical protein